MVVTKARRRNKKTNRRPILAPAIAVRLLKSKVKLLPLNKKTTTEKANFCFKHRFLTTLKSEQIFTSQKPWFFRSTSCFGVTKITTPNRLQKTWKRVNRFFLKKTAPQYNSNSLNCKNQENRNIAQLSLQLRSYNKSNKVKWIAPKRGDAFWRGHRLKELL